MQFRRHLSWNNHRENGVMEALSHGGEVPERTLPRTLPPEQAPQDRAEDASGGSTTLFYRLKGLMAHKSKVSF